VKEHTFTLTATVSVSASSEHMARALFTYFIGTHARAYGIRASTDLAIAPPDLPEQDCEEQAQ